MIVSLPEQVATASFQCTSLFVKLFYLLLIHALTFLKRGIFKFLTEFEVYGKNRYFPQDVPSSICRLKWYIQDDCYNKSLFSFRTTAVAYRTDEWHGNFARGLKRFSELNRFAAHYFRIQPIEHALICAPPQSKFLCLHKKNLVSAYMCTNNGLSVLFGRE